MIRYIVQKTDDSNKPLYLSLCMKVSENQYRVEYTYNANDAFLYSKDEIGLIPSSLGRVIEIKI